MSAPRPSLWLSVTIFLFALGAAAAAQPALPRGQVSSVTGSIRSLVDRLYSPDARERAEAACQLGRRRAEAASAIPVLLSMLADDVVVPAIECEMQSWGRNVPMTAEARRWMETSPAKEAAEALGDIGNASVPGLLTALDHSDAKVRQFAALGLGEIDRIIDVASVVTALGNHLADGHPDVRDRSAWALGEIEHPSAVEPLVRAFADGDARVRVRVAWALGEIEHPSAVEALVTGLNDSDAAVREKSVWALGEIESDLAVDGLVPLLNDGDSKVRRQVAWALGEIESPAAVPALVQSLTDNEVAVRRQAAWALGEIEHPSAVDGLVRALADSDAEVRRTAAWALGEIEDPAAIDELRAVANDANSEVRRAVEQALRELGDRRRK
jgi:HEAT repeat protein